MNEFLDRRRYFYALRAFYNFRQYGDYNGTQLFKYKISINTQAYKFQMNHDKLPVLIKHEDEILKSMIRYE